MSLVDRAPDAGRSSGPMPLKSDANGISLVQISPRVLQDVSQPLPIVFNNVSLSIKSKPILTSVSGQASDGKLTALMGPTGAGKTSLLNVLAHRVKPTGGTISYGPYSWSSALKRHVGVVEQDDIVYPQLTVRQSLRFVALLRLPRSLRKEEKLERVEHVISQLKLMSCADTKVGDSSNRGISGGERKRLCIAREFITRPRIVLFDEPTSGLDSTMAAMVTENMQTLSKQGVVIISSIHQPSSHVFNTFDQVLFLDAGQLIYQGAVKSCTAAFDALGYKCPTTHNPADYVMDLIVLNKLEDRHKQVLIKQNKRDFEQPGRLKFLRASNQETFPTSWYTQFYLISFRTYLSTKNDMFALRMFLLHFALTFLAGILWFDLGLSEREIYQRTSLGLWTVGTWQFFPMFGSIFYFSSRMVALRKEMYVDSYRLSAYFVAQVIISTFPYIIWSTMWMTIVYAMTLSFTGSFLQFLVLTLTTYLNIIVTQGMALSISAGVSEENTLTVTILLMSFMFPYTGLLVPLDQIPSWISWSYYVNIMVHVYEIVLYALFQIPAQPYTCLDNVTTTFEECTAGETVISPDAVVASLKRDIPAWVSAVVVVVSSALLLSLAFFLLRRKLYKFK